MIDIKKIHQKVEERRRISLDSFLDMMDSLGDLKKHGSKKSVSKHLEPELRHDLIEQIKKIETEKAVKVKEFAKRYKNSTELYL